MRYPDGTLIGDLNDGVMATTSGSLIRYEASTLNENETFYDLLPVIVNKPPVIIASITDTSTPPIKTYTAENASGNGMYLFPDGSVKVNLGVSITLRLDAKQPDVLNVENGILKLIPTNTSLLYTWRKDGAPITSDVIESLQSSLTVSDNTLVFVNVQPEHAGAYTCTVSNDIGSVVSEPITLEVYNLDFDSYFYKNLITNPYGADEANGWESSGNDLTTKKFSKTPSHEYTKPNRIDLFGYTKDMLHPRPYQIDTGVIKGFDMVEDLVNKNGSYFTRSRFKFQKLGGTTLVRAYQDIDLADIQNLIKGSVYGVTGVRMLFSCYIGNAISYYIPVDQMVIPSSRLIASNYDTKEPRLSVANFLKAGPAWVPQESIYVTIEEYDNETRLESTLLNNDGSKSEVRSKVRVLDPWNKAIAKPKPSRFYVSGSKGDFRDALLFAADTILPDKQTRSTYGQYIEFNKLVFDRLNPRTTKVRVSLNFETKGSDWRVFQSPGAYGETDTNNGEIFEHLSWQVPYIRNSWSVQPNNDYNNFIPNIIKKFAIENSQLYKDALKTAKATTTAALASIDAANEMDDKEKAVRITIDAQEAIRAANASVVDAAAAAAESVILSEIMPSGNEPRGLITALNVTLIPILSQQDNVNQYNLKTTLAINDTPTSTIATGLQSNYSFAETILKYLRTVDSVAVAVTKMDIDKLTYKDVPNVYAEYRPDNILIYKSSFKNLAAFKILCKKIVYHAKRLKENKEEIPLKLLLVIDNGTNDNITDQLLQIQSYELQLGILGQAYYDNIS